MGLKKGDIIFNHKQTEDLFKHGYVTGRGRTIGFNSHAQGTVSNDAFYGGSSGSFLGAQTVAQSKYKASNYSSTSAQSTAKEVKEASEDFQDAMDFVALAIERVTKEIELHSNIANDLFQTFRNQNPELNKAISQTTEQISLLQKAYDRYMAQANATGLDANYQNLVRNGALDIQNITDENLKNKIEDYQKWYNLAEDIKNQIIQAGSSLRDLNVQKLDNIVDDFDRVVDNRESLVSMIKALNDLNNLKGIKTTADSLKQMMGYQTDIAGFYKGEYEELKKEFDSLVSSGAIDLYNDDWWEYTNKLVEIQSSAYEAEQEVYNLKEQLFEMQAVEPLDETLRQLNAVKEELETISDLINEDALFDDNSARITNAGIAQLAVYAEQLHEAKQRSAEYTKAIENLKKNLLNGNITQEKYNELLEDYSSAQQQAVKDTKSARDAIIDMRVKGIEKAVTAFEKLINVRKEDLQAQKEYKDEQKQLNDKADEINAVAAQIAALEGDPKNAQKLKQLQNQKMKLEEEYNDMVEDNRYNAEMKGYDDALELYKKNADEETKMLQTNLDYQNQIIAESLEVTKTEYESAYDYLNMLTEVYGANLQTDVVDKWKDATSATQAYTEAIQKANAVANVSADKITVPEVKKTSTTPSNEKTVSNIVNTKPIGNQASQQSTPAETSTSSTSNNNSNIWNGIAANKSWYHKSGLNQDVSIYDRIAWNGYTPSYASQKQLYSNLGGSGTYSGTGDQNYWMVQQLKARGFKTGGVVGLDQNMIKRAGEDGIALVRNEDVFLKREDAKLIKDLLNVVPDIGKMVGGIAKMPTIKPVIPNEGVSLHIDTLLENKGTIDREALPGLQDILNKACDQMKRELRSVYSKPGFGGIKR